MIHRKFMGDGKSFLALLLIIFLSNCTAAPRPPVAEPSLPAPVDDLSLSEADTAPAAKIPAQEILERFDKQQGGIRSLRALANLDINSMGEKRNIKAIIVSEPPVSLRLEFLSFIGQPLQFLVCRNGNFWFYSPFQNMAMTGETVRFNIYRLLGVNMELNEIINILLANPSLIKSSNPPQIKYNEDDETFLVQINEGDTEQLLWLDGKTYNPKKLVIQKQQQIELLVFWDDYREENSILFPGKIQVQRPQEATELEIKLSDTNLNQEITSDLFSLDIPSYVKKVALPDSGIIPLK